MITRAWPILAAGLLVAADAKEDFAQELKKLQGTWKVVAVEAGGMKVPGDKLKAPTILIKGDRITIGKDSKELVFKINPAGVPPSIDLTDAKDKITVLGIYSLEKDELRLCIPLASKDAKRPTGFDTKDKPEMAFTARREQ